MPPFILALAAAALASRLIRREWLRVNQALDEVQAAPAPKAAQEPASTLRRDPESGVWRPS